MPRIHVPHLDGSRLIEIFRDHADSCEVGAVWGHFQAGPGNGLVHFWKFANHLAGGSVHESDYLVGARSDHLLAVGRKVDRQRFQQEIPILGNKLPGVRVMYANDGISVGIGDGCAVARKSQRNRAAGNGGGFPQLATRGDIEKLYWLAGWAIARSFPSAENAAALGACEGAIEFATFRSRCSIKPRCRHGHQSE